MKLQILYFILFTFFLSCNSPQEKVNHSDHEGMSMNEMQGMSHTTHHDSILANLVASPAEIVISNAATVKPVYRSFTDTISASGYITFDGRRSNKFAMRAAGRIEKLYVKLNYQYIHKGDKILELYSPELNTAQEEFLHHLRTVNDSNLIEATKQRLMLLGFTENQLTTIQSTGKAMNPTTVYSPYDGFILLDFAEGLKSIKSIPSASIGMSEMSQPAGGQSNSKTTMSARIREGDYVKQGQTLFVVNDFHEVYGIAAFATSETDNVKLNAPVKIQSPLIGSEMLIARINFIEPVFADQQKFIQARFYLNNASGKLKVNSTFIASIETQVKQISIPASSVISLGKRSFVWIKLRNDEKGNLVLRAKEIFIGKAVDKMVEVIEGVTTQDEIAKDAGYLLDSESLIQQHNK